MRAEKGVRVAGYLIDVLPALLIGLLGMIPVVGMMLAGMILAPYWLLRDVSGASLGKLALGTRVVSRKDGGRASIGARVLRNIPLAVGPTLMMIPFLGYILGPSVAGLIVLIEAVLLLTQGERLGDRLAGTMVMKRRAGESALGAAA